VLETGRQSRTTAPKTSPNGKAAQRQPGRGQGRPKCVPPDRPTTVAVAVRSVRRTPPAACGPPLRAPPRQGDSLLESSRLLGCSRLRRRQPDRDGVPAPPAGTEGRAGARAGRLETRRRTPAAIRASAGLGLRLRYETGCAHRRRGVPLRLESAWDGQSLGERCSTATASRSTP